MGYLRLHASSFVAGSSARQEARIIGHVRYDIDSAVGFNRLGRVTA